MMKNAVVQNTQMSVSLTRTVFRTLKLTAGQMLLNPALTKYLKIALGNGLQVHV